MIPAKRLAEIQERGGQTLYPFELAELVTAYEAARRFATFEHLATWNLMSNTEHERWLETRTRFLALFPEPTK